MLGRHRTGVTLVEMAIVLAVIGAMVAVAFSTFDTWDDDQRLKSSARAVADAFTLARAEAIRTGDNHLVVFAGALGATEPIAIVNDGPEASANCAIDGGETVHTVGAAAGVQWGTSTGNANGTAVPDDPGAGTSNAAAGTSFTDASMNAANPATWVLYQADGLPRVFTTNGSSCTAVGDAGEGGGALYLTNTRRDYAVVLRPLGTARVHIWNPATGGWSN